MEDALIDKSTAGRIKTELSHLAYSYVDAHRPTANDWRKHRALRELKRNPNIVILKPDKGNSVVIMDRKQYNLNMLKIINDTNKFKLLKDDPTITREGKLQRFLRSLKSKGHINSDMYKEIYPVGSQPARMYGLPKMHKVKSLNENPP